MFALDTVTLTAQRRDSQGLSGGLAPHYQIFAALFWIAAFVVAALIVQTLIQSVGIREGMRGLSIMRAY